MYKEVDIGNNSKIVFFYRYNFWKRVLDKIKDITESIDIVTYNFDFKDQKHNSFYNELLVLAEKGIRIRLMYSPAVSKDKYCDNLFEKEILCVRFPNNHSKIFISDTLAFIGSANFSLYSNNNYECGFLTENTELIKKLRSELINNGVFQYAQLGINPSLCVYDPLSLVQEAIKQIERVIAQINHPEYINQYVDFNYDIILGIQEAINDTCICDVPDQLLVSYYEIKEYLKYVPSDNEPHFLNDVISSLKYSFEILLSCLLTLKKNIELAYDKYGKHNYIDCSQR